jgi:RNA polymerase sigma-70 factor (ECF subfamily)
VNTKEAALVPHSRSDADLARDVNAGDASAFEQVFDRHATTIYNYCFRRTASWDTAQDATSTVFLEAWRTRERLAVVDDSVLPWLYGIATNVCRNANRSATRYLRALTLMPVAGDVPDHADDVAGRLDDQQRMQQVLAGVEALPVRERDVIALVVWEQLDYASTAAALGIPIGTVRSRLSRARARLSVPLAIPHLEEQP